MVVTKSVVAEFVDQEAHLRVVERDLAQVGSTWVLVKVAACALVAPNEEREKRQLLGTKGEDEEGVVHIGQEVSGTVKAVGHDVCGLQLGERVVGIVPLDYKQSGCSSYVVLQEFDLVPIPSGVSFAEAAAAVGDSLKVYTALHYLGRLNSADTVLLIGGASPLISVFVQLAHHWSARVIAAVSSPQAKSLVTDLNLDAVCVIETESKGLKSKVMQETGELGADIVVNLLSKNEENIPSLHEMISCLSVGGRLITANPHTQLDPPHCRQLLLRCASIGFLFEQAWILSSAQQGRYQHILMDIMEKVATKTLKPHVENVVNKLEEACEVLKMLQPTGGKVVLSLT